MAVAGYEYRIDGGTPIDVGNVLTVDVTGLTPSTEYSFQVRAYDEAGNRSAWTDAATATTDFPNIVFMGIRSAASNGTVATTSSIDTSGATLFVAEVGTGTVTDSESNTWTALSAETNCRLYYCQFPSTSATHTFTNTGGVVPIMVMVFSGTELYDPVFDLEDGFTDAAATTIQPGSVTPSQSHELLVTSTGRFSVASDVLTVDQGFTATNLAGVGGASLQRAMAYKIQTTAAAQNPTWTWPSSGNTSAVIATFKRAVTLPPADGALRINTGKASTQGLWINETIFIASGGADLDPGSSFDGLELNAPFKPGRTSNTHVYASGRQSVGDASFGYRIPALTPSGSYVVRVHAHDFGVNEYHQSIKANGVEKVAVYDVGADAGAGATIDIKEFTATADGSGDLLIECVPASTKVGMINALEVRATVNYRKIVTAGDSITYGGATANPATMAWPAVMAVSLGGSVASSDLSTYDIAYQEVYPYFIHKLALVGNTFPDQQALLATYVDPYDDPLWAKQIMYCSCGTNDIINEAVNVATLETRIDNFFAAVQPGWLKVIGTIFPRASTDWSAYNDMIRGKSAEFDLIIDWDDLGIDPNDTAILSDGTHPTAACHELMAAFAKPLFEAL